MTRPLRALFAVPIDQVHPSPNNPRGDLDDLGSLALSLQESGMLQPIVVQKLAGDDGFRILAGHRRHAAARKLGWREVPVLVRGTDMLPDDELVAMLAENGQRAALDPIEEAHAYKRLIDAGHTQAQVGARVGRSTFHVSTRLALLTLPAEDQAAIRAGERTITEANDQARERRTGRPKGATNRGWHFDRTHALAEVARARCKDHPQVGRRLAGGVACGPCWEAVIREHERDVVNVERDCRDIDDGRVVAP